MALSNDKILIAYDSSDGTPIDNAQWGDNLPVLVQAKLIESLDNSHYFEAVSRPVDGFEADEQLLTELRGFRIVASPTASAHRAISAKTDARADRCDTRIRELGADRSRGGQQRRGGSQPSLRRNRAAARCMGRSEPPSPRCRGQRGSAQ